MNEKPEVGPDIMNVIHPIIFNHHFHAHLTPGWHARYIPDIPFFCMFYDFIEFLIPVFDGSNVTAGFIKALKPKRTFFCEYAAKVAGIPTGLSLLKICRSANHEKSFCHRITWKLFIVE